MYLCPKCEEEIPNKVKRKTEECPFCHEPWPPEEAAEPEPAVPEEHHPEGWGEEFVPSKPVDASAVHHEEPKKSKTLIFVGVGVVAVLIGVGLFFGLRGGDKGKGGGGGSTAGSGGVTEEEISAIDGWYREVGKTFKSFLGEVCSVHHNRGYKYNSHFNKRVQTQTVKGKKVQTFDFDLKIQPAADGKAQGALNIFECPVKLAELHRDHPIIMEAKIWERREVFGAVYKFADIEIKGKLVGHLDKKYRKINRNVVLQNRDGFAFSRMKSLPKEKRYEGYRALSTPMKFRMASGIKSFTISNLTWIKIKPGKYLQGEWRMILRTNEFQKQLKDWDNGCFGFRKRIAKLDKPKSKHVAHHKLTRAERKITADLCTALTDLAKATKGEQTDTAAITKARTALNDVRTRWNRDVYQKLKSLAKKKDSAIRSKPL